MATLKKRRKSTRSLNREIKETLNRFSGDKFAQVRNGTLVRRSAHWYHEHPNWPRGQLGIVVDSDVYDRVEVTPNGRRGIITFPLIHWEGEVSSSGTHPDNADIADSAYARRRK
jgi:hypothetical protein